MSAAPDPRSEKIGDKQGATRLYAELARLIERLHRRFLDVVRIELTRLGIEDISPVQALMLMTISTEEISVRDLIERGYYLGSNASYNLKSLVEQGYVLRTQSQRDRRSARLKLSAQGGKLLASGTGTAADGIIRLAGAENAIGGFAGYKQLSDEAVIGARPDAILMMSGGAPGGASDEDILSQPAIAATPM